LKKRICIATPALLGPITNSGIGAHCTFLAELLSEEKENDVHILFTAKVERETPEHWQREFQKKDITLHYIDHTTKYLSEGILDVSYKVFLHLKGEHYDEVHLQDWNASGFVSVQAKQSGVFFQNTKLIVSALSSEEWIKEGMKRWQRGTNDHIRSYCERYSVAFADALVCPTQHMLDWLQEHSWELPKEIFQIPFVHSIEREKYTIDNLDFKHFCFYGRLETRKGLELFVKAVILLLRQTRGEYKVSFLGKNATVNGGEDAVKYIRHSLKEFIDDKRLTIYIHNDFSAIEAVEYVMKTKSIAILPSLKDNLPYTILDCIEYNLPFLASDIGGISEVVDERLIFPLDAYALFKKLLDVEHIDFKNLRHGYLSEEARKAWKRASAKTAVKGEAVKLQRRVSVSIAAFWQRGMKVYNDPSNIHEFKRITMDREKLPIEDITGSIHNEFVLLTDDGFDSSALVWLPQLEKESIYTFYANSDSFVSKLIPSLGYIPIVSCKYNTIGFGGLIVHKDQLRNILELASHEWMSRHKFHIIASILVQKGLTLKVIPQVINNTVYENDMLINDYDISSHLLKEYFQNNADLTFALNNILVPYYMNRSDRPRENKRLASLLSLLPTDSKAKIAIYGYNNYGLEIYQKILPMDYSSIAILDKNSDTVSSIEQEKYSLKNPAKIKAEEYDYYIIASDNHKESMKNTLKNIGIEDTKIVYY
jgi:glycosyltransferase involved in cell wall biosynthesis